MAIAGAAPGLGDWDPAGALGLEWSEGDVWKGIAKLPPGDITFKVRRVEGCMGCWGALLIKSGAPLCWGIKCMGGSAYGSVCSLDTNISASFFWRIGRERIFLSLLMPFWLQLAASF